MSVIRVGKLTLGVNFAGPELLEWSTLKYTSARIPVESESYKILDIRVKDSTKLISRSPVTFGSQNYYGESYSAKLGWASAISVDGPNELVPNGDGRTTIDVFGRTEGPKSNPEGYGNIARNDCMKNAALISGSWPIPGKYLPHTKKTIKIRDDQLEIEKITGTITTRDIEISDKILNAVARRAWFEQFEKGGRRYQSELKIAPAGDAAFTQTPGDDSNGSYEVSATAKMSVPSAFTWKQDIGIYYDDVKQALFLELVPDADSEEERLFQYIESRNEELANVATRRGYGEDVKVNVETEHPSFDVSGAYEEQYEIFKDSFDAAAKRVNDIKVGSEVDLLKTEDPTLTEEQIAAKKAAALSKVTDVKSGTSAWQQVWDSLKSVGSWAGDTVREWGPVGMVGAYAGYETVKAAKRDNMLVWLALGLGAIVLLK